MSVGFIGSSKHFVALLPLPEKNKDLVKGLYKEGGFYKGVFLIEGVRHRVYDGGNLPWGNVAATDRVQTLTWAWCQDHSLTGSELRGCGLKFGNSCSFLSILQGLLYQKLLEPTKVSPVADVVAVDGGTSDSVPVAQAGAGSSSASVSGP